MHLIRIHRIFLNKIKIFTAMYFVEPIVRLFAIRDLNMYVYSLFANIISLDTIYSLKFSRSCFCSIIRALIIYIPNLPKTDLTF